MNARKVRLVNDDFLNTWEVTPKKIGATLRGAPVIGPETVVEWWRRFSRPVLLTAVASRGARALIRAQLEEWGLEEGVDYWCAA